MDEQLRRLERIHAATPRDPVATAELALALERRGKARAAFDLLVGALPLVSETGLLDEALRGLGERRPRALFGRLQHAPRQRTRVALQMLIRAGALDLVGRYADKRGAPAGSRNEARRLLRVTKA